MSNRYGEREDEPIVYEAELVIRLVSTHVGHPTERSVVARCTFEPGASEVEFIRRELLHLPVPPYPDRYAQLRSQTRAGLLTLVAHKLGLAVANFLAQKDGWHHPALDRPAPEINTGWVKPNP